MDECSKQLVLNKIRLILCDEQLTPNTDCDVYSEDGFISFGDSEVSIDGGAFNDDSDEMFLEKYANQGECKVHAYEPDKDNYKNAIQRLSGLPNITVVQKGLWSSETELAFSQNARVTAGSFVVGVEMGNLLPTISLDIYFANKLDSDQPTFIKMDIEGTEREALFGCTEIIKNLRVP